jgi:RNA polymerase sigma-70 factor (ECF subfamily)
MTRNRQDAEDVVQQSFQKAFTHLEKFEAKSSFSTWLTRIAINEALMLLRRGRGSHEVAIDDANGNEESAFVPEIADSSPDPEDSYSQRERKRILSAAMNQLTPGVRKAIELRELNELSTVETARVMGLSVQAVKGRIFHGRKKLRETLKRIIESTWMSRKQTVRSGSNGKAVSRESFAFNTGD